MNITLPEHFHPQSRVWIYQSDRTLNENEVKEIKITLDNFVQSWKSHGDQVKGYSTVYFDMFIVMMADESSVSVGGCSMDSSVRIMKEIEKKFNLNLFNREMLTFQAKEKLIQIPLSLIEKSLNDKIITEESLYFNNTILSKLDLETKWIIPLKNSWLSRFIKTPIS
jgi:hypothetical protein